MLEHTYIINHKSKIKQNCNKKHKQNQITNQIIKIKDNDFTGDYEVLDIKHRKKTL